MMDSLVLTPAGLLEFLVSIDELADYDIQATETIDGNIQIQIGESVYQIKTDDVSEIEAPPEVVEELEDINETAYDELLDDESNELTDLSDIGLQDIETGLIADVTKFILLKGLAKVAINQGKDKLEKFIKDIK